jgi:Ca2+-binding EF-hand superfamily protein
LQREVQNCTFEPAVTKKNHRPTRPIASQSSPAAFKRKVKQIFHTLDVDNSGTLSLRELKKGMIQIPALSEIIAPGRSLRAYANMSKETGSNPNSNEVTLLQFQSFCADATSLTHFNTFERRVGRIFEAMDLNQNGSISVKELKKGMIHIPELSELIAPKRFRDALNELQNSSTGAMDKNDFFTFCKKSASINHVVDTPERKSDRMYQHAKETLENRDRSHVLHIQKQAADIDAECTFVPLVNNNNTKKNRTNRKHKRNNNADDENTSASSPPSSRFEQLYTNGVQQRKQMDNIAIQQRNLAEKKIYEACSFSPKVNRSISTSTSTSISTTTAHNRPPHENKSYRGLESIVPSSRITSTTRQRT